MFKQMAKAVTVLSLLLSASISTPAWSAGNKATSHKAKCTNPKHRHVKRTAASPARGVMIVEHHKRDVQILSFGP